MNLTNNLSISITISIGNRNYWTNYELSNKLDLEFELRRGTCDCTSNALPRPNIQ